MTPLESLAEQMVRLDCRVHMIRQPVPSFGQPGFITAFPIRPEYNGREIGVVALLTPEEDAILRQHGAARRSWSGALARDLREMLA